jgi:hypothetical protein
MDPQGIRELQQRIVNLEASLQRVLALYPVTPSQGQDRQSPLISDVPPYTPAPEVAEQEKREAYVAKIDRISAGQAAAYTSAIDPFDPYAWGEAKEGQSAAGRRQELVQIQKRREARNQAQEDLSILNQSTMDIDSQPPEAQFAAAQAFADEHKARVVREQGGQGGQPPTPQTKPQGPQPPYVPGQGQPPYRMTPPYVPQPDTSTQIPQPPDWRDTPERLTRGPTQSPGAQQQTFYQAQASFDAATARQMQMLAGFIQDATRRVEELECWRESMAQE